MVHIIALSCIKGGVGKTTTAVSLGGYLSSKGKKVLLVDLDPQCNLTNTFTDGNFDDNIYEAFKRMKNIPVVNVRKGLDIVPSSTSSCNIETEFLKRPNSVVTLRNLLKPVKENYDWIFIDCPPSLGQATANALFAADYLFVPMIGDKHSCDGLVQVFAFSELVKTMNESLETLGVFVTRFDSRRVADQVALEALKDYAGDGLFKTKIRECTAITQASMSMTDIFSFAPKSHGAEDYEALAKEMMKRISKK